MGLLPGCETVGLLAPVALVPLRTARQGVMPFLPVCPADTVTRARVNDICGWSKAAKLDHFSVGVSSAICSG
jgi:hypothetical protein